MRLAIVVGNQRQALALRILEGKRLPSRLLGDLLVADAQLGLRVADLLVEHECDRRRVVQAHEAMPGARHAMHPIERDEFHAEHVGEERDLRFHVAGRDGEVMQTVGAGHGRAPEVFDCAFDSTLTATRPRRSNARDA